MDNGNQPIIYNAKSQPLSTDSEFVWASKSKSSETRHPTTSIAGKTTTTSSLNSAEAVTGNSYIETGSNVQQAGSNATQSGSIYKQSDTKEAKDASETKAGSNKSASSIEQDKEPETSQQSYWGNIYNNGYPYNNQKSYEDYLKNYYASMNSNNRPIESKQQQG